MESGVIYITLHILFQGVISPITLPWPEASLKYCHSRGSAILKADLDQPSTTYKVVKYECKPKS